LDLAAPPRDDAVSTQFKLRASFGGLELSMLVQTVRSIVRLAKKSLTAATLISFAAICRNLVQRKK